MGPSPPSLLGKIGAATFGKRNPDSSDTMRMAYMRITSSSVEPSGRKVMSCSFGPSSLAK